jgi:hypothetical protein
MRKGRYALISILKSVTILISINKKIKGGEILYNNDG